MTYAERLPQIVAEYKAELKELERRRWEKWQVFRDRIAAVHHGKEAAHVPARS